MDCLKIKCLNLKALVDSLNKEKAIVGAFSMIVKTDGSFSAVVLARSQPLPLITHGPVECDNGAWPHVTSHIIMAHTAHSHHNTAATQSYRQYFGFGTLEPFKIHHEKKYLQKK